MTAALPSQDFCRCGHIASAHIGGENECDSCLIERPQGWQLMQRCQEFRWALKWEEPA